MNPAARTLVTLDWPYLLEALANHARTETGRRLALSLPWIANEAAVEEAFDAIEEIHSLRERRLGGGEQGVGLRPRQGLGEPRRLDRTGQSLMVGGAAQRLQQMGLGLLALLRNQASMQ